MFTGPCSPRKIIDGQRTFSCPHKCKFMTSLHHTSTGLLAPQFQLPALAFGELPTFLSLNAKPASQRDSSGIFLRSHRQGEAARGHRSRALRMWLAPSSTRGPGDWPRPVAVHAGAGRIRARILPGQYRRDGCWNAIALPAANASAQKNADALPASQASAHKNADARAQFLWA